MLQLSYDSNKISAISLDNSPFGIIWKSDGTKWYFLGGTNKTIFQISASTPWILYPSTSDSKSLNTGAKDVGYYFNFSQDGTHLYFCGAITHTVYQYDLSVAWDISTATYSKSISIAEDPSLYGIDFKTDGTKMYLNGASNQYVYQYTLSTAWDVTTATYDSVSLSVGNCYSINLRNNGYDMFLFNANAGNGKQTIDYYVLSTAWNVSTGTLINRVSAHDQAVTPQAVYVSPTEAKAYIPTQTAEFIYQYTVNLGTNPNLLTYKLPYP